MTTPMDIDETLRIALLLFSDDDSKATGSYRFSR